MEWVAAAMRSSGRLMSRRLTLVFVDRVTSGPVASSVLPGKVLPRLRCQRITQINNFFYVKIVLIKRPVSKIMVTF